MYTAEIGLMIHGFGDSSEPLPETVELVQTITLNQIRGIVQDGFHQAARRGSDTLIVEDIVFLMRRNPTAIQRLLRFLKSKEMKSELNADLKPEVASPSFKKNKITRFIEKIDETGELSDMDAFDSIKFERQLRADRISLSLDRSKYMEYYKARCTSFLYNDFSLLKNSENFRKWLLSPDDALFVSNAVVEVLAYLAHETIGQIVDLALLVRLDVHRKDDDPLAGLTAGNYCTPISFHSSSVFERFKATSKVQEGQKPITPAEIREAVRRYETSQIGQMMAGPSYMHKRRFLAY